MADGGPAVDVESAMDSLDQEWAEMMNNPEDARVSPPPKRRRVSGEMSQASAKKSANPKAKTKPKAVAKTILKATSSRGPKHRLCKGCRKKIPVEECPPGFYGCYPCKRALDNITKLAARQGEEQQAFVRTARADDDKCFAMVQSYLEACPESLETASGKKRGQWSVVRYMERVTAATGLLKDAVGEMMWLKLYIEFAQTTRGGRLTDDQALATWKQWEEKKNRGEQILHDFGGPDNSQLRFWVKTADTLTYRSSFFKEKSVECEGESIRKASDDQVDRLKANITRNHGNEAEFDGIAASMAVNGQNAFLGKDGFLDILQLKADVEDDSEDEAHEPEATASLAEGSEEKGKKDKKADADKTAWVERDKQVSQSVRAATAALHAFQEKSQRQLARQESEMTELIAKFGDEKSNFMGEIKIYEVRLEALKLCLQNDETALKQFIARFAGGLAVNSEDADASRKVEIGNCPPIELYQKLQTFDGLSKLIERYHTATQAKHIKDITAVLTEARLPLSQLLGACLRAEKSIKGAQDQLKKQRDRRQAEAQKPRPNPASSDAAALFDQGAAVAEELPRYQLAGLKDATFNMSAPFVIAAPEWVVQAEAEKGNFKLAMDEFITTFDVTRKQQKGIRVSKVPEHPLEDDSFDMRKLSLQALGHGPEIRDLPATASAELIKAMSPSFFGIDAGYDKVSGEYLGLPVLRLTAYGTRKVVLTEMLQLVNFMVNKKGIQGNITVARCSSFFKCMGPQVLKEYKEQSLLFTGTIAKGDVLYLPCGSLCAEYVTEVTVGYRLPVLLNESVIDKNIMATLTRKTEELKAAASSSSDSKKAEMDLKLLEEWIGAARTKLIPPVPPSAEPRAEEPKNSEPPRNPPEPQASA
ncbi:unnamed protein product [Symbiodinium sp. CCMP2592]|nr:unnamed protein product [Symbiodinium sp. CCMP2592]